MPGGNWQAFRSFLCGTKGLTEIAGLDIDGLDNGGPDIDGLDIAGLDIAGRLWIIDYNMLTQ